MVKRVLLTASVQSHLALFYSNLAKSLQENGYEVHAAASNDLADKTGLKLRNIDKEFEACISRSPYNLKNIKAYRQLKKILAENTYDIIHCNSPMGGVLTRLAARKLRKRGVKVIYTAHGFHFFEGAPLVNWLVYYPAERLMARYTDVLITINKEDYARAGNFKAGAIEYIPGIGVDIEKIDNVGIDPERKRKELGILPDAVVLLSVGELNRNKNHETAIRALAMTQNNNIHMVICGQGSLENHLKKLSSRLRIENRVHFLGFRTDVVEICKASDIFVFPSKREGLPASIMEAMACGLPVVCSRIRGNSDLIEEGAGGYLCPANNADTFAEAIKELAKNKQLREKMGEHNRSAVQEFDIAKSLKRLREIYG